MKHIDKFDDYYSIKNIMGRVVEGLNSPLEVEWKKDKDKWQGSFSIEEKPYEINIVNFSTDGHWLFKFSSNKSYALTNDLKKAFSVLPTIENAAIQFIEETNPDVLIFCAADNSEGRKKLYTIFSQNMCTKFKMMYYIETVGNQQMFIVHKRDFDGVNLAFTIKKIMDYLENENI